MHVFRFAALNAAVLMGGAAASLSAADPWIGAWTLNRTKSHVTRAEDMPLDSRLFFVDDHGQQRLIEIGRDMHRKPVNKDCAFRQDGRDNQVRGARRMGDGRAHGIPARASVHVPANSPAASHIPPADPTAGSTDYDTLAFRKAGSNMLAVTAKQGGRIVGAHQYIVSKDGHTLTVTMDDTTEMGAKVRTLLVYQK